MSPVPQGLPRILILLTAVFAATLSVEAEDVGNATRLGESRGVTGDLTGNVFIVDKATRTRPDGAPVQIASFSAPDQTVSQWVSVIPPGSLVNGFGAGTHPIAFHATPLPAAHKGTKPTGSARVIVKLRSSLAQNLVPDATAGNGGVNIAAVSAADPKLRALLTKHAIRAVAPLSPGHVRAKQQPGSLEAVQKAATKRRFSTRAARAPSKETPPDLSSTYIFDLGVRAASEVADTVRSLKADANVLYAEEDKLARAFYVPNDPSYSGTGSWGQLYDDLYGLKKIDTSQAWDTTQGQGVVVAVVDTGVDYNHPDISANIWTNAGEIPGNGIDDDYNGYVDDVRGWDFAGHDANASPDDNDPQDGHFHGTHVAGTIAAVGDNSLGVVGVAWKAKIMPVKGLDDFGVGYESDLARAIIYAVDNGADVINASWGGEGFSQTEADAIDYARTNGVVFVAAAGNSNSDANGFTPANIPAAITVGSQSPWDTLSSFSNFGSKIDVVAPGEDILSLETGTAGYVRSSGTSMAAPHVSGVVALILAQHPAHTTEQVRQALRLSAVDLDQAGRDTLWGSGRVNAAAALLVNQPLEARILSPREGTAVSGSLILVGSASGPDFDHFVVDYGAGAAPSTWTSVMQNSIAVQNGNLGAFDPATLPDGLYTIRLRAFNGSGDVYSHQIQVWVRYLEITSPLPPSVRPLTRQVKPGVGFMIEGSARGPSFQAYSLEWASGIDATTGWSTVGITLAGNGTTPVTAGALGTWIPPVGLEGYYTIRLTVNNTGFSSVATTSVYVEPALISSGYPLPVASSYYAQGPVPVRHADGTTRLVLSGTYPPSEFRSFASDGSAQAIPLDYGSLGQPVTANLDGLPGDEIVAPDGYALKIFSSDLTLIRTIDAPPNRYFGYDPLSLVDLDNDGTPEIIAPVRDNSHPSDSNNGEILVFRTDGSTFTTQSPTSLLTHWATEVGVVAVDLDGDGRKEIVVAYDNYDDTHLTNYTLRAFNADGSPYGGWGPIVFSNAIIQSFAAADLDHDGTPELVIGELDRTIEAAQIRVVNANGVTRAGWPIVVDTFRGNLQLSIGDLDRNLQQEIVAVTQTKITILSPDGSLWNQPWSSGGNPPFNSVTPPVLADIDHDGLLEILAVNSTVIFNYGFAPYHENLLTCFNQDGTIRKSWPIFGLEGQQPFIGTPVVGDFNGDGLTDVAVNSGLIAGGGINGWLLNSTLTWLTLGTEFNAASADWTGRFGDAQNSRTPPDAPMFTSQPQSQSVSAGDTVTFIAAAAGSPIPRFQWRRNGTNIAGATSSTLTLSNVAVAAAGSYDVVVTNPVGSATSGAATLVVSKASATVTLGHLGATYDGTPKSATATTNPSGLQTTITYNGSDTAPASPGSYAVVATVDDANYFGSASGSLVITDSGPAVTGHSATHTVLAPGDDLTLNVTVAATSTPSYQWFHNGHMVGGNNSSLALTDVDYAAGGAYWVVVTNLAGSVRSVPMFVGIAPTLTQVRAWGQAGYDQSDVPASLPRVLAVSAGYLHSLLLKVDGTVLTWGGNNNTPIPVPGGLQNVVAVSAGDGFSVALKSDGTVVAWGSNTWGQTSVPNGLSGVVAISAGRYHVLAVKSDGTVVGWGANFYGSLDIPGSLSGVTAVSAGDYHSVALKADGTVVAWGYDQFGQVGFAAGLTGVAAVDVGSYYSLALKTDGTVVGAGYAAYTQVAPPAGLNDAIAISAGTYHSLAIRSDRSVMAWGGYHIGTSTPPSGLSAVVSVSSGTGGVFTVVLRDATGDTAPIIDAHPVNQIKTAGESAMFTVAATAGTAPLSYQWRKNTININGATDASFSLPVLSVSDAGSYDVVVTNYLGSVTSNAATLTVKALPVITWSTPSSVPYGTALSGTQLNATANVLGTFTYNPASGAVLDAGTQTLEVTFTPIDTTNYATVTTQRSLDVNPAPATFALSASSFTYTGSAQGPTINPTPTNATFTTGGTLSATNAGSYTATATATGNYSGSNTALTWTIAKATPSVTWNPPATMTFGTPLDSTHLNATAGIPGTFTYVPAAGTLLTAGTQSLQVTFTPTNSADYNTVTVSRPIRLRDLRIPEGFDVESYYRLNPDVAAAFGADHYASWLHFLNSGINEGRVYDDQFRVDEYLELYPDLKASFGTNRQAALMHWLTTGKAAGRLGRVPKFFDADAFLQRYGDLSAAFGSLPEAKRKVSVWNHYLNIGVHEGRNDGDFDAMDYLADHPDLEAAFGTDLMAAAVHWYVQGRYEGRRIPAFFSVTGYFERNGDIAAFFGTDLYGAWLHYRDVGVIEGRSYNEEFRVDEYIAMYPDLQAAFGTDRRAALMHWLQEGRNEERAGRVPTAFDHAGYFARNPDVAASLASLSSEQQRISAWTHFFYNGVNEGRNFDSDFRVLEYLFLNPDVQAAYGTKLGRVAFHWLIAGKLEGRRGRF